MGAKINALLSSARVCSIHCNNCFSSLDALRSKPGKITQSNSNPLELWIVIICNLSLALLFGAAYSFLSDSFKLLRSGKSHALSSFSSNLKRLEHLLNLLHFLHKQDRLIVT